MTCKLLSILIPTYNRAESLELLLNSLAMDLNGFEETVDVIIGNNASSDNTPSVISRFQASYPSSHAIHHASNLGAEENFCQCISASNSKYLWIIGDDDLPKEGVIGHVVSTLKSSEPDLLYLNSEWLKKVSSSKDGCDVSEISVESLTNIKFARRVNVFVTFISAMVFNFHRLKELKPDLDIRQYTGTSLVQLGWVMPLLVLGERFCFIKQRCILAKAVYAGGYKMFEVFATNFLAILAHSCASQPCIHKTIKQNLVWSHIPNLIWAARFGYLAAFEQENILHTLVPIKKELAYWLIMFPLATFPKPVAYPFIILLKACNKIILWAG